MYTNLKAITTAKQLWHFRHPDAPLEREGDNFRMNRNGILYTCTFTRQGEVTLRQDKVENTTDKPVTVDPIRALFAYNGGEYEVYSQYSVAQNESIGAWQELVTQVVAFSDSERTTCHATPFMVLWSKQTNRGTAFHVLPTGTWQLTAARLRDGGTMHRVCVTAGFCDHPALTLAPGESVELPTVLFYPVRNRVDMDAWKLHRWFNTYHPRRTLPLLYNTWLYRYDHFTPEQIASQIPVAAQLGLEYFVIDAGWFGKKCQWSASVGDWEETKESAMEGKLLQIAQQVRKAGMKFGLWFEVERASFESKIAQQHPEYFVHAADCCMLNFAREDARNYLYETLERFVAKYGIEFIKFDCNRDLYYSENDTALIHYFQGFQEFIAELRRRLPNVYFGCCASGGMRMDIPNAIRFDSFWISDNQSPLHTMRIFKDTVRRLPPQVMERWATFICSPDFAPISTEPYREDKLLATHDGGWSNVVSMQPSWLENFLIGGINGFSCDLTTFTPQLIESLREQLAQYKADEDFWLRAECRILCDTPLALVVQYNDPAFDRVEISVFLHEREQRTVPVFPVLDLNGQYTLDGETYTGAQLDETGIQVALTHGWHAKRLTFLKTK